MASPTLNIADLDFDQIKSNLKKYLSSQNIFKDYNFEGPNITILLDILAYNTHYNAFYANMIANEMFLDTATLRESVVSRAKMLGYTPFSKKSSLAYVNLTSYITAVNGETPPNTITLEAYAQFSSYVGNNQYTFITKEDYVLDYMMTLTSNGADSWIYAANTVMLYEGTHLSYQYEVQENNIYATGNPIGNKFIIPDSSIDADSLIVTVQTSSSVLDSTVFNKAGTLQTTSSLEPVYWLQEIENQQYEIKFGDGQIIGKNVEIGNLVNLDYISTNGAAANGCRVFSPESLSYTWTLPEDIVENKITSAIAVSFRTLYLDQSYSANYTLNETVIGSSSRATGVVVDWDNTLMQLVIIPANGIFNINEAVVGLTSGVSGTLIMSSLEVSTSANGTDNESIDSIKLLAPGYYQTQNRCVTTRDYEILLKQEYPTIRSIKVWGGEEAIPPVFGKVFLSLRPNIGQIISNKIKTDILNNYIKKLRVSTVQTEIIDPEYIYIIPTCDVRYNPINTKNTSSSIISLVQGVIVDFAKAYLTEFDSPFYYTQVSTQIDNSEISILSNILSLKIKKYFEPNLNQHITNYILKFSNKLILNSLTSSTFVYKGVSNCQLHTNPIAPSIIQVINSLGVVVAGGESVGTINYDNGVVTINNFITTSTTVANDIFPLYKGRIELIFTPAQYDIFARENQILDILNNDIIVTTTDIRTLL